MIIAVDFDGTLCVHEFPKIGPARLDIIDKLKEVQSKGFKLILWTCRSGKPLNEAVAWCKERGLLFDAVNDDIPAIKRSDFGKSKSIKVFANIYLDDKNIDLIDFTNLKI